MPPLHVAHVVSQLQPAGVEVWLGRILPLFKKEEFCFTIFVEKLAKTELEAEIARHATVHLLPMKIKKRPFVPTFANTLTELGLDAVHNHLPFKPEILLAAELANVPVRIAHSHNDLAEQDRQVTSLKAILRRLFPHRLHKKKSRGATTFVGCSQGALTSLYGKVEGSIIPSGIPIDPSLAIPDDDFSESFSKEWNLPTDKKIIGHVGRFVLQKNHSLFLNIAIELLKRRDDLHFVFVGEGPLQNEIRQKIDHSGLGDHFTFVGKQKEVLAIMATVFDLFLFPSLFEGFGVVLIEAQLAGLPIVASETIPKTTVGVTDLFQWIDLKCSPALWADAVEAGLLTERPSPYTTAPMLMNTPMDILYGKNLFEKLYRAS
ncbi:MAG: glycosyltransferase [Pirellulaceae bacterium]|nr:glycosyltransferase [Pirellulaceae bacterium]